MNQYVLNTVDHKFFKHNEKRSFVFERLRDILLSKTLIKNCHSFHAHNPSLYVKIRSWVTNQLSRVIRKHTSTLRDGRPVSRFYVEGLHKVYDYQASPYTRRSRDDDTI